MEELVILDYSDSTVHFYKVNSNTNTDEDYIRKLGYNPDGCSWMFGEYINVVKHKGIIK